MYHRPMYEGMGSRRHSYLRGQNHTPYIAVARARARTPPTELNARPAPLLFSRYPSHDFPPVQDKHAHTTVQIHTQASTHLTRCSPPPHEVRNGWLGIASACGAAGYWSPHVTAMSRPCHGHMSRPCHGHMAIQPNTRGTRRTRRTQCGPSARPLSVYLSFYLCLPVQL